MNRVTGFRKEPLNLHSMVQLNWKEGFCFSLGFLLKIFWFFVFETASLGSLDWLGPGWPQTQGILLPWCWDYRHKPPTPGSGFIFYQVNVITEARPCVCYVSEILLTEMGPWETSLMDDGLILENFSDILKNEVIYYFHFLFNFSAGF